MNTFNICDTRQNQNSDVPYHRIGYEFAKAYYEKMSKQGVNIALELFSPNVQCTLDQDEFKGSYNWLLRMTKSGASKFEYHNVTGTSQLLNDGTILVNVIGELKALGLWGQYISGWLRFNELFILEKHGTSCSIRNYMLRLIK